MTKTKRTKKRTKRIGISWRLRAVLSVTLALLALIPVFAAAGPRTGAPVSRTVEGTVLDHTGHPVVGAVVLIEDLKSLQVRSYIVQADGKFHFRGLSSDANYELRARFKGTTSHTKTISVFESKPVVDVTLTLSSEPKHPAPPPPPANPPAGKSS